jgi:thiamine-phosphate pyrophosphorylase
MDQRLIAWARTVKRKSGPPPLWLFTDPTRIPDLLSLARTLPPRLCGIIYRHDCAPNRLELGLTLARLCRARRIALAVAGDARLAARLNAGLHLRGGHHPSPAKLPRHRLITASAHNPAQVQKSRQSGAAIIFISPVFPTASHPGAPPLGLFTWRNLARRTFPALPGALGGIMGATVRTLGKRRFITGAIDAFL